MIHDRNIICIASNWFEAPTSKHHVMRLLSQHNNVIWVNYHGSRRPSLSARDSRLVLRRLRQAWSGAQRVTPTIDVLSPVVIPFPESRIARGVNARGLARRIRAALRGLPQRPLQLWLFAPDVPELIDLLPVERVVYYCVDDFAAFSGFNAALIERLEERTLRGSDVVIATSEVLRERCAGQHGNVHLVPHGVDFEHFAAAAEPGEVPAELQALPRPVLGYVGLVSDYIDFDAVAYAADHRPEWSFVFIGDVSCDVGKVRGRRNVHLLGARAYEALPGYCRAFDVGLIPFRMNRLTRAVNPIKLREYLAAGLPVVSAPMDSVRGFAPAVRTASTPAEFLEACADALHCDRRTATTRQALVRQESWNARVEQLSHIVESA